VLTQEENFTGLAALNRELIAKAKAIDSSRRVCEESAARWRSWLPRWPEGLEPPHLRLAGTGSDREPGGALTPEPLPG
jgi:hypothetical protein